MKFRISRKQTLKWPNKCVCCGDRAIVKYSAVGIGFLVPRYISFSVDEYEEYKRVRVAVEYPVCRKHYFWSLGINVAYLVFYGGMFFSFFCLLFILQFDTLGIYILRGLLLPLPFAVMLILAIVLQPVRIRWVRRNFYTLIIRNEDYAREFAMLNHLTPT
jgi:hypothetical protein